MPLSNPVITREWGDFVADGVAFTLSNNSSVSLEVVTTATTATPTTFGRIVDPGEDITREAVRTGIVQLRLHLPPPNVNSVAVVLFI